MAATNYFRVGAALIPFDERDPDAVDAAFKEAKLVKASMPWSIKKPAIVLWKPVPGILAEGYVGVVRDTGTN